MIKIYKVVEHEEIKEELLALHDQMRGMYPLLKENPEGFNSLRTKLRERVLGVLEPYFLQYAKEYGFNDIKTNRVWVTHYNDHVQRNGGWHNHPFSSLASAYQLDVPSSEQTTRFLNHDVELKEGDLVVFPSFLAHSSPDIKGDVKTVIGADFDIFECIV